MRYLILISMLSLAACGPRFEARQKCFDDNGGYSSMFLYTPGGILGAFNADTQEGRAYNQSIKDCIARTDTMAKGD